MLCFGLLWKDSWSKAKEDAEETKSNSRQARVCLVPV